MIIGLDRKKYRKKLRKLWLLTLILSAMISFFLAAKNAPSDQLNIDYSTEIIATSVLTFLSMILLLSTIRLNKYASHAISFQNGELNDFTKLIGKIRGLKIENIESISIWAEKKKINRYRLEVKRPSGKTKNYFIFDNFVDTEKLFKLAESIGNEIANRKSPKSKKK